MLHDIAYTLLYRAPSAAQPFPVRDARHLSRVSPWSDLAAALERRWLGLYGSSWSVFPLTLRRFRVASHRSFLGRAARWRRRKANLSTTAGPRKNPLALWTRRREAVWLNEGSVKAVPEDEAWRERSGWADAP